VAPPTTLLTSPVLRRAMVCLLKESPALLVSFFFFHTLNVLMVKNILPILIISESKKTASLLSAGIV
jgi:hypothetical protein